MGAPRRGAPPQTLAARPFSSIQVSVDNRAACYDITSYLCSLGHRRICHVQGPAGLTTTADRLAGFQAAMADAGLPDDLVLPGDFDYGSGQQAALRMVGRELPDAVVAANDESAIGVLTTLRQAGVDVPGEVSVAGIDDTRASRFVDLTTVSVPMYELGAIAARRVLDPSPEATERTILPHRLVPRGTTARRRAGLTPPETGALGTA
jgi:LacI family transcriptional regulator